MGEDVSLKRYHCFKIIFIGLVITALGGCSDKKDPAQDVVDEFSEKVDAFEEKYKSELDDTETVPPSSFILTNFYSDYAAKITAPDGFIYYGDDTVLSTDEEAYPVTDLFFYDSETFTSLQYAFNEYDPFELMNNIDYMQECAEYTDIKAYESVDINVNGMTITYKKLSYVFDNSMQCVDYMAIVPVNEFQYFYCSIKYMDDEKPWFGDDIIEKAFQNVELYQTGEEPLVTYYWDREVVPDENGVYHIKDIKNSREKAAIAVPDGYLYDDSNVGQVYFLHAENSIELYQSIRYSFIESDFFESAGSNLRKEDSYIIESDDYSEVKLEDEKTADICNHEVQYARIEYKHNSTGYCRVEYWAFVKVQEDYLEIKYSCEGEELPQIDDSILEIMLEGVKIGV